MLVFLIFLSYKIYFPGQIFTHDFRIHVCLPRKYLKIYNKNMFNMFNVCKIYVNVYIFIELQYFQ